MVSNKEKEHKAESVQDKNSNFCSGELRSTSNSKS